MYNRRYGAPDPGKTSTVSFCTPLGGTLVTMVNPIRDWNNRIDAWLVRHRGVEAMRQTNEEVLAKHRRWFGERAFSVVNGKYTLGCRLNAEGRNSEALELFQQVFIQRTERYRPDHRRTRQVRCALGATLCKLGRNEEARDVLEPLVADCARLKGDADQETQLNRLWLASALIDLGDEGAVYDQLARLFDVAKANGWWSPEGKQRAEEYWRAVTSDEPPK